MKDFTKHIGGTFLFNAQECIVRDIYLDDGTLIVLTNKGKHRIKPDEFRKEFLPVDTEEDQNAVMAYHGMDKDAIAMRSLGDVLMENINKIKDDPKYIEQARAINESAKAMIELQKTKIDMVRVIREVK